MNWRTQTSPETCEDASTGEVEQAHWGSRILHGGIRSSAGSRLVLGRGMSWRGGAGTHPGLGGEDGGSSTAEPQQQPCRWGRWAFQRQLQKCATAHVAPSLDILPLMPAVFLRQLRFPFSPFRYQQLLAEHMATVLPGSLGS